MIFRFYFSAKSGKLRYVRYRGARLSNGVFKDVFPTIIIYSLFVRSWSPISRINYSEKTNQKVLTRQIAFWDESGKFLIHNWAVVCTFLTVFRETKNGIYVRALNGMTSLEIPFALLRMSSLFISSKWETSAVGDKRGFYLVFPPFLSGNGARANFLFDFMPCYL